MTTLHAMIPLHTTDGTPHRSGLNHHPALGLAPTPGRRVPASVSVNTLQVGAFLIGAVEDPALWGYPDVRY